MSPTNHSIAVRGGLLELADIQRDVRVDPGVARHAEAVGVCLAAVLRSAEVECATGPAPILKLLSKRPAAATHHHAPAHVDE